MRLVVEAFHRTLGISGAESLCGAANSLPCGFVYKVNEGRPNIADLVRSQQINSIINSPLVQDFVLRRARDPATGDSVLSALRHFDLSAYGGGDETNLRFHQSSVKVEVG